MNDMRDILRLHREYLDELVKLRMLPYGQTMNYNPTGGKSSEHPGGRRPSGPVTAGEKRPDHDRFAEAWMRCRSVSEREQIIKEMRECLHDWKHAKQPEKLEDERVLVREVQAMRGWTAKEVADAKRTTVGKVQEWRLNAKCCPAKGYPYKGAGVVELADRGNSVRQIAEMLGISKSVVDRMLQRAA